MESPKPCPFCGGVNTKLNRHTMWTGMRNQLINVSIQHWCDTKPFTSYIELKHHTEEEALSLWNTRVDKS